MEEVKTFDYDKFLKHVLNKTDLAAEIMHIFFEDINSFTQSLVRAVETEDFSLLRKTAHRLKGSSLNVCAGKLSELFLRLEGIGKNNSVEGATELIGEIFGELENFRQEVRNSNIIDN
jgi:HPt (histidine-containing phosphotransfer) domain-containing protein